jgi:pSer/pThr/pTyr-binding forkhead associated (FHA) protein
MNQPKNDGELTSTLHLGLRSVVDGSPESAVSAFLSSASEEESAAITAVIDGPADRAMVVIHRGPAKGARFLVDQSEVAIGRSVESPIFLDDVTVSRKHALLVKDASSFRIKDQGSLNGTYVNNKSVTDSPLSTGDEIQIGKFHMLFIASKKSQK